MGHRRLITSPAFQFYPQDWLVGTSGMSLAARGAYMQIIAFGWLKGPLTFDLTELAKLIGCTRGELDDVWPQILPKLRETKRGFVNRRVEKSRGELRRYRESKRQAALTRWAKEKPHEHAAAPTQALTKPSGNPHHKPSNLINGADIRRHGTHAWCSWPERDGLCVPMFLHKELLGKSAKSEGELKAWYASTVASLNGHAVGEDALVFWRNSLAAWVGTATAAPDMNSKSARTLAAARQTLERLDRGEPLSVFSTLAAKKPS